jgi:hypothetical protein
VTRALAARLVRVEVPVHVQSHHSIRPFRLFRLLNISIEMSDLAT